MAAERLITRSFRRLSTHLKLLKWIEANEALMCKIAKFKFKIQSSSSAAPASVRERCGMKSASFILILLLCLSIAHALLVVRFIHAMPSLGPVNATIAVGTFTFACENMKYGDRCSIEEYIEDSTDFDVALTSYEVCLVQKIIMYLYETFFELDHHASRAWNFLDVCFFSYELYFCFFSYELFRIIF